MPAWVLKLGTNLYHEETRGTRISLREMDVAMKHSYVVGKKQHSHDLDMEESRGED